MHMESLNLRRPQELNGPPRSGTSDAAMPC